MPELKRGRTLIGIPVPTPNSAPSPSPVASTAPTPAKTPEPLRSRTLIGIAAPIPGKPPEQPSDRSDEAPVTQPSESPIAAAVQDFLGDKPKSGSQPAEASPSKPPPAESKSAAAESKAPPPSTRPSSKPASEPAPAPSAESRAKAITLAEPLSKRARAQSQPPASETGAELGAPESRRGSGSIWVVLLVAAGLAGVGFWLMSSAEKVPPPAAEQPKPDLAPPPPAEPAPAVKAPEPQAPATAAEPAPAPVPSSEPVPAASGSAPSPPASAEPAPPAGDVRRVVVTAKPPQAKFFRKGKEVSGSPMTVDLAPGEKRAFEVGLPGFVTRKVVVDGTKPEITVGLRPETAAAPGASADN